MTAHPGASSQLQLPEARLLHASPAVFMSRLLDERGRKLVVAAHHEEWLQLFERNRRAVLMAPRDHGKSVTEVAYLLWCSWRHNRHPDTGTLLPGLPDGTWQAVIFSARLEQAGHFFETFQRLMVANEWLFSDMFPDYSQPRRAAVRDVWSSRRTRLKNKTEISVRAFGGSARGLHPNLIILDDVLSDENSGTDYQREKTWQFFSSTVLPMNPDQLIVVGTAFHRGDLLHRLRPVRIEKNPSEGQSYSFAWRKYRAIDPMAETALWHERHPYAELEALRAFDAAMFAREFQNDPVDDASSLFPFDLTDRMLDPGLGFVESFRREPGGAGVVLGFDPAASAETAGDYCCLIVMAVDLRTFRRRLLWAHREKGLSFQEQVELIRGACRQYGVDIGFVEENGFQRWLCAELAKYPETSAVIRGHTTGLEKGSFQEGVPSLKLGLSKGIWDQSLPCGDSASAAFASILRTEASAFGLKNGKYQGFGEHDDTVMTWWLADRAARLVQFAVTQPPEWEMVTMEDLGIEPVDLGDY